MLEGSPLGLELAAGWLRFLEPSELLDEVRRDFDVLRARSTDIDPAHASLGAVFESSWSLLGEAEREGMRRLAVFRGGCTRDSAVAVADVPLATLLALTNRSLLQRDGNTRFTMHTVVQHFADGKLAERPATAAELEDRHGEYFLALAQDTDRRIDTPDQGSAIARLAEDGANVTAALGRALDGRRTDTAYELVAALARFWRWRGRAHEALDWIDRLRSMVPTSVPTVAGVRVRLGEGRLLENTGRYAEADAAFDDALADAELLEDQDLVTTAHLEKAIIAWRRGDLGAARTDLERVCDRYRGLGREASLAGALGNLGNVTRDAGDLDSAHACYDEALAIVERIGRAWDIANIRNNKAIAFAYARDLTSAAREFEQAYELQKSIDNTTGMSQSLMNLGVVLMDSGDVGRATELYAEALALFEQTGDADGLAHVNVNLGVLAQQSGDFDAAHARFSAALQGRRAFGSRSLVAQSVLTFLGLAVARGAFERAFVLNGAVKRQLDSASVPLPAPQRTAYDESMATAHANVLPHRAAELERRGAALADAEVLEFALGTRALP
jgi:tetratricopeptide (TPR) repeat protein